MQEKLASASLDITDAIVSGNIEKLAELITTSNISEEAKSADVPSISDMKKLAEDKVALILYHSGKGLIKKYAHYTPELTELNSLLLADKESVLPDEIVKTAAFYLKKASERWGCDFPLELRKYAEEDPATNVVKIAKIDYFAYKKKLNEKTAELTKETLDKLDHVDFALPGKRKYPIFTEEQVKVASAYFDSYHKEMDTIQKVAFAYNTYQKAKEMDIEVCEDLYKYANLHSDEFNPDCTTHIAIRKDYVNFDFKPAYAELTEKLAELGPIKTVAVLEALDKKAGITHLYGRKFEEPIISVLKEIREPFIKVGDRILTQSDTEAFNKCSLDSVDNNTRNELRGENGLAVFNSLPYPVQDEIFSELDSLK